MKNYISWNEIVYKKGPRKRSADVELDSFIGSYFHITLFDYNLLYYCTYFFFYLSFCNHGMLNYKTNVVLFIYELLEPKSKFPPTNYFPNDVS